MSDRKHVWEFFHPLEPEDIKSATTITIRLEDGSEADVDDGQNWFADDESVFQKVIPVANNWPDDDYFPLPLLLAHKLATWVAKEIGATVVTPKPVYKPSDYEVPPGAVA